jgi:hypothetical protein
VEVRVIGAGDATSITLKTGEKEEKQARKRERKKSQKGQDEG